MMKDDVRKFIQTIDAWIAADGDDQMTCIFFEKPIMQSQIYDYTNENGIVLNREKSNQVPRGVCKKIKLWLTTTQQPELNYYTIDKEGNIHNNDEVCIYRNSQSFLRENEKKFVRLFKKPDTKYWVIIEYER